MPARKVKITNKLGLHARAAARFVQTASRFGADVNVAYNGKSVSGKSIMSIMMLAATCGSELEISASGSDEAHALDELEALVRDRFGEDE